MAQVAWPLMQRAYTNNNPVGFGYVTSGRDAPVSGTESDPDVFINVLISDLEFATLGAGLADSIDLHYRPLSEIKRILQFPHDQRANFKTVLSFYCYDEPVMSLPKDVAIDLIHLIDMSEFVYSVEDDAQLNLQGGDDQS
ncbi:uncharacterized protein FRV6_00936 [Fusarium oxysporum]|uniref:Uncharacterized protein n=1 Tax=Fusarium oxysporum TaxID=5507 RepID=A0A2H3SWA0_FUSOX|nr:uncharacterized protein FRV6_00936 [Fusarium oxysporum]